MSRSQDVIAGAATTYRLLEPGIEADRVRLGVHQEDTVMHEDNFKQTCAKHTQQYWKVRFKHSLEMVVELNSGSYITVQPLGLANSYVPISLVQRSALSQSSFVTSLRPLTSSGL